MVQGCSRRRRATRVVGFAVTVLALAAGCAAPSRDVVLTIANADTEALRCLVIFGHWVTAEMPVMAPGAEASVTVVRDNADRSLLIRREGDGRAMMVEHIVCDRDAAWGRAFRRLGLDAVRRGDGTGYATRCDGAGCGPWLPAGP